MFSDADGENLERRVTRLERAVADLRGDPVRIAKLEAILAKQVEILPRGVTFSGRKVFDPRVAPRRKLRFFKHRFVNIRMEGRKDLAPTDLHPDFLNFAIEGAGPLRAVAPWVSFSIPSTEEAAGDSKNRNDTSANSESQAGDRRPIDIRRADFTVVTPPDLLDGVIHPLAESNTAPARRDDSAIDPIFSDAGNQSHTCNSGERLPPFDASSKPGKIHFYPRPAPLLDRLTGLAARSSYFILQLDVDA